MTKKELLNKYRELAKTVATEIDGIGINTNKTDIQKAIDCLERPDETLDDYAIVVKLKHPNIHAAIMKNENWKKYGHNRFYIYYDARLTLYGET